MTSTTVMARQKRLARLLVPLLLAAVGATVYWQSRASMVHRFLAPHMFFGALALAGAPAALLARKGGWWHRRWGAVYLAGMAVSVGAAIPLALHMHSAFFVYLSIFCLYLPFAGFRALGRRPGGGGVRWWDRGATVATLGASLGFLRQATDEPRFATVTWVFGLVMLVWTSADLFMLWRHPAHPHYWLIEHVGKLLGSYVAAVTAFLVVQVDSLPLFYRYVLPGAVGAPLILAYVAWRLHTLRRADRRRAPAIGHVAHVVAARG